MIEPLERLVRVLARLPGLGRRSAERIALRLAWDRDRGLLKEIMQALQELDASVRLCSECGAVTLVTRDPCELCTDPRRDSHVLCVVEDPADIAIIEASTAFRGRYHALLGHISPMRGQGPQQLRFERLLHRIRTGGVTEVIIALDTDAENEATARWLGEEIRPLGVRVTRIAYGLPVGSGIAYADPQTLQHALAGRVPLGG